MSKNATIDRLTEVVIDIRNEQRRGLEDRTRIEQSLEGIRKDLGSLLGLPDRMSALERLTENNHNTNVLRLNAIEGDVRSLQTWRAERDGVRKGVIIGVSTASAVGGGSIGAVISAFLRKHGIL